MPPTTTQPPPLGILRLGLVAAPVLLGVVAWFTHKQPGWAPSVSVPAVIRYAVVALSFVAILSALTMRRRIGVEPNPLRRRGLYVLSWAISQPTALVGGVVYLLTDERQWFLIGFAGMLIGFAVVPIRRET